MAGFDPRKASLDDLTGWLGNATIDSINYNIGMAEIQRRQTKAQIDASDSQIVAAEAETRAAEAAVKGTAAAERNAKYMLGSVLVAAAAAIFSAISALATLYSVVPHK
jgi:hypothetical protein